MQKMLLIKVSFIALLSLFLLIPLGLIEKTVSERSSYRNAVTQDIAKSWTGKQFVTGPILTVPYRKKISYKAWDAEAQKSVAKLKYVKKNFYYLPNELKINGDISLQERYRGLYKVPVYNAKLDVSGNFDIASHIADQLDDAEILWGDAFLSLQISDVRGISNGYKILWNDQEKEFVPGTHLNFMGQGIFARLGDQRLAKNQSQRFSFSLDLNGIECLQFAPIGKTTYVALNSDWPHPSFDGCYLPQQRDITDDGFTASWSTSHYSTNMSELLRLCNEGECKGFSRDLFGVSFIQPVDIYQQAERSIKYAILFILLTFVIFFTFEMLKGSSIHPIQYGLVGLGLAIFYLLLISLSEHIAFAIAYGIASIACIVLLTFYVTFVMKTIRRGLLFGGLLTFLYGILYIVIRSEDYALLMGSILVFATLAATMYFTRRIDWYRAVVDLSQQYKGKGQANEA